MIAVVDGSYVVREVGLALDGKSLRVVSSYFIE